MLPVFHRDRGEFPVEVCVNDPVLVHPTDPPWATLTGFGEKKYSPTETVAADAGGAVRTVSSSNDMMTSARRMRTNPLCPMDGTTGGAGVGFMGYRPRRAQGRPDPR